MSHVFRSPRWLVCVQIRTLTALLPASAELVATRPLRTQHHSDSHASRVPIAGGARYCLFT
jgi:hypothetical protein